MGDYDDEVKVYEEAIDLLEARNKDGRFDPVIAVLQNMVEALECEYLND